MNQSGQVKNERSLSSGSVETRPLDMEMARLFIGARLLWDLVGPDVEPLSPENVLIFITGPIEVTVIGNALMQFITLGEIKDIEEGRHIVAHMAAQERYNPDWTPDCQPTLSS